MKYPLQIELEKCINESAKLLVVANTTGNNVAIDIANKYLSAINRINEICVNRKRY